LAQVEFIALDQNFFALFKMPASMAPQHGQDWEPVVFHKNVPQGKAATSAKAVNAAMRSGGAIAVDKKHMGGENKSSHGAGPANSAKFDTDDGGYKHAGITHEFKVALMQARTAKKMTQAALAQQINEKQSVVNDYESGRAIPNGQVIQKLNKVLGCRLPKAKAAPKKISEDK